MPHKKERKKLLLDNLGSLPSILKSFGLLNSDAHEVSMVTAVKKAGNWPRCLKLVQVMLLCITKIRETLHSCLFAKGPSCDVPALSLTLIPHFHNILPATPARLRHWFSFEKSTLECLGPFDVIWIPCVIFRREPLIKSVSGATQLVCLCDLSWWQLPNNNNNNNFTCAQLEIEWKEKLK